MGRIHRSISITGLSAGYPLPGHLSEISFTSGGGDSVIVPGGAPTPIVGLYSDLPQTITAVNGLVSAWGTAVQATGGAQPSVVTDSVTGISCVRADIGKTLSILAGANFLHQGPSTLILVARQRITYAGGTKAILDSSANGATAGWQLQAIDNNGAGAYRNYRPRISNGTSFPIDHTSTAPGNQYASLKTNILVVDTSSTLSRVEVDHALAYSDTYAITLPTAAGGPFVIGNCQWDIFAIEAYNSVLSDVQRGLAVDRLAARFSVPVIKYVASDNFARNLGFPSMAKMNDGRLIATYRNGIEHSGTDGVGHAIFSSDQGSTWAGDITLIANDGSGEDVRESCVAVLTNHDVFATWFTTLAGGIIDRNYWKRSTDNGATWSAKTLVTFGYTSFEATSGPVIQKGSRILWPVYVANTADAFTRARVWYSDDNAATWTDTSLRDGLVDSRNYSEPNLLNITVAAPGLSVGDVFALVRDDAGTMVEGHSTTGIGGWTFVETGMAAHSAARMIQLADGTILALLRPNAQLVATLYKRVSAGNWTAIPDAPAIDAYPGVMIYGAILELSPGTMGIVSSVQQGNNPNDRAVSMFRKWPEWQVNHQMPASISPATVTVTAGATQQFTALGAGNTVWSLPTSGSTGESINASTGLYTAGTSNGTTKVRATDLNGYSAAVDATITITGGVTVVPPTSIDATNLTAWWDPTAGLGLSGSLVNTWTSSDGTAKVLTRSGTPQLGANLNTHPSIDFNGTTDLFNALSNTLANFLAAGTGWTVAWVAKDTGSPADVGIYFENSAIFNDGSVGNFGLGTTSTKVYAGQDGNNTHYDSQAQSTGVLHYYVAKYDVAAGKIFISQDGGAFSVGTTVSAIPAFTGIPSVGKSGVLSNYFKGSLGDLAIWKSTLSTPNVTAIQAYYANKYA